MSPQSLDVQTLLLDLAQSDPSEREGRRQRIVEQGEASVAPLIGALSSEDHVVRQEATRALAEIGGAGAALGLIRSLGDDYGDIRWIAAEGLIEIGRPAVAQLLAAIVQRSGSRHFREGAHHVLKDWKLNEVEPELLAPILASLEGTAPEYRAAVAASAALSSVAHPSL